MSDPLLGSNVAETTGALSLPHYSYHKPCKLSITITELQAKAKEALRPVWAAVWEQVVLVKPMTWDNKKVFPREIAKEVGGS